MEKSIIIVKSITYAMRGQQLLNNYGVSAYLERNIGAASKYGCGYSLRVATADTQNAAALLRSAGIRVVDILPLDGAGI
ncbi:MAG: putative Se/S carrier-like protein [Hydrogenoanaerobacterium sp.]